MIAPAAARKSGRGEASHQRSAAFMTLSKSRRRHYPRRIALWHPIVDLAVEARPRAMRPGLPVQSVSGRPFEAVLFRVTTNRTPMTNGRTGVAVASGGVVTGSGPGVGSPSRARQLTRSLKRQAAMVVSVRSDLLQEIPGREVGGAAPPRAGIRAGTRHPNWPRTACLDRPRATP